MTDLAKELARDLEVKREAKVTRIETDPTHFTLHLEHGGKLTGKAVLLTAPLPQALLLLDASSLAYDPGLKTIDYDPALVLLLKLDKAPALPFWNLENPFPSIRSISNQETKGVSGTAAWTVVFDSSFSSTHFEGEETLVKNLALAEVLKAYPSLLINEVELKKWRYSRPRRQWRTTAETVTGNPRLVLAGDAFGGDGIDGALRSGKSAVDLLL
jgi:predicted NAD/FAD-dependent oxidoreductase